jgi:hypothetical protein
LHCEPPESQPPELQKPKNCAYKETAANVKSEQNPDEIYNQNEKSGLIEKERDDPRKSSWNMWKQVKNEGVFIREQ